MPKKQPTCLNEIAEDFLWSNSAIYDLQKTPDPWFKPDSQDWQRLSWGQLHSEINFRPSEEELAKMKKSLALDASWTSENKQLWKQMAWYQPMHFISNGEWGIYFDECKIRRSPEFFARFADDKTKSLIEENLTEYFNKFCLASLVSLFLRELFVHQLECSAIRFHFLGSPSNYANYFNSKPEVEYCLANAYAYRRLDEDTYRKKLFGKIVCSIVKKGLKNQFSDYKYCISDKYFTSASDKLIDKIHICGNIPTALPQKDWSLVRDMLIKEFDADDLKRSRLWFVRERVSTVMSTFPIRSLEESAKTCKIPSPMRDWLQKKQELLAPGTQLPDWPRVLISDENPPLFVSNPSLKKWYEEDRVKNESGLKGENNNSKNEGLPIPREENRERDTPNTPEIEWRPDHESLQGAYFCETKRIVIWHKGVDCCSKLLNIDYHSLFNKVLIHELGHWFNAEAHTPNRISWDLTLKDWTRTTQGVEECPNNPDRRMPDLGLPNVIQGNARSLSSRSYHEVWAQFFAWLYGHEVDGKISNAFNTLEPRQSSPYQAWRKLVSQDANPRVGPYAIEKLRFAQEAILQSLEWSRGLGQPVTFDDQPQGQLNTNMLQYMERKHPAVFKKF